MNWKSTIGLALVIAFSAYWWMNSPVQESVSVAEKKSISKREPSSNKKLISKPKKTESELSRSGLAAAKVEAINQLRAFHISRPDFTEENVRKREGMLEVLIIDPKETVEKFSQLMQESKDDSLKGFLLNLTMNSKLDDHDKADIFLARMKAGAEFSKEGLVTDEEISFMIGISHLSRLENVEAKNQALERLKVEGHLFENPGFQAIYRDYFKNTP